MFRRVLTIVSFGIALFGWAPTGVAGNNKLALVVANSDYGAKSLNLAGPLKDAEALTAALKGAGFDVEVVTDATKTKLQDKIAEFKTRLEAVGGDAVAFFYYSGHGASDSSLRGENYLLPVVEGDWIKGPEELDKKAIGLKTIVDALRYAEPRPAFSFVVIDACRNIAFQRKPSDVGNAAALNGGFVGVEHEAPEGMLIAYATGENQTADDKSYYSSALAEGISTPGLESRRVFVQAMQSVMRQTSSSEHRQVPTYKDRLINDYFFIPKDQDANTAEAKLAAEPAPVLKPSDAVRPAAPLSPASAPTPPHATDGVDNSATWANDGIFTGFSGALAASPVTIDPGGQVVGQAELLSKNSLRIAQKGAAKSPFRVTAADIGQVFGLAADMGANTLASHHAPNVYLAATSVYGLPIERREKNGDPAQRLDHGGSGAVWAKGLFGSEKGGGPGSIWKLDGETGSVSLFANIQSNGASNSGAALGQLAFDPRTRQLFASDLDTGLIHRLNMRGVELGVFDHGVEARPKLSKLTAAADDPKSRADPVSPAFSATDPSTWGLAQDRRRVWGLTVRGARLFYGVTDGPEVWSVGIRIDGTFDTDARRELAIIGAPAASQITKIEFDPKGNMYVGLMSGVMALQVDRAGGNEPRPAPTAILRYKAKPVVGHFGVGWVEQPEEISAAGADENQILGASFSLGFGFDPAGAVDANACAGSLWATAWRPAKAGRAASRTLLGWTGSALSLSSVAPNESIELDGPAATSGIALAPLGGILAVAPCENPQEVAGLMTQPGKRPEILPPTPGVVAESDMRERPSQSSNARLPTASSSQTPPTQRPSTSASNSAGAVEPPKPGDTSVRPTATPSTTTAGQPSTSVTAAPQSTPAIEAPGNPQPGANASNPQIPSAAPATAPTATDQSPTTTTAVPIQPGTSDTQAKTPASAPRPVEPDNADTQPQSPTAPPPIAHLPANASPLPTAPVSAAPSDQPSGSLLPPCMNLQSSKFQCVAQSWELALNLADNAGKGLDALKVSPLAIDSPVEPGLQKRASPNDPFRVRFDNVASGSEVRFDVCLFDEAASRNGNPYRCCRAQLKVELPAAPCNKPIDQ